MVYPAMVIGIAVVILTLIMIFIVPRFEDIFKKFDIKGGLPRQTQFLINVSHASWPVLVPDPRRSARAVCSACGC